MRFDYGDDEGVGREIFLRRGFHLVQRHGLVERVLLVGVGVAQAVDFIGGGAGGESAQVLRRDFAPT